MKLQSLSPRRAPLTPGRNTPRAPPPAACVDVQWKFLPPSSVATRALPPCSSPSTTNNTRATTASAAAPVSTKPLDCVDNSATHKELQREQFGLRREFEFSQMEQHRVLFDLMGETQRQAMLDKVMAEMEAMALTPLRHKKKPRRPSQHAASSVPRQQPHASPPRGDHRATIALVAGRAGDVALLPQRRISALGFERDQGDDQENRSSDSGGDNDDDESSRGQANGSDNDGGGGDDGDAGDEDGDLPELRAIRERHHRRMEAKNSHSHSKHHAPRILWQKSSHVRAALDLPPEFVQDQEEEVEYESFSRLKTASFMGNVISQEVRTKTAQPLSSRVSSSTSTVTTNPRSPGKKMKKIHKQTSEGRAPSTAAAVELAVSPRTNRVRRAHYGSWYVPQNEWWPAHQCEQETLAELFPQDQPAPADRHECSMPPEERTPKDPVSADPMSPHAWPSLLRSAVSPLSSPSPRLPPPIVSSSYPNNAPATAPSIAARSPRVVVASRAFVSSSPSHLIEGKRMAMATTPDAIALRATELQHEIPKAYIAREYRSYLLAKGARVPSYLNY